MGQKKVINPLLSKNDNGISLAESVTKITGANADSKVKAVAFRKEKSDWHAIGWKKFTEGLVINFVMEMDGLTFPLAVKKLLKEKLGHDLTDEDADCKYLNSADSELYHKSYSIFGIESAIRSAKKQGKLFLVEGAPDVMKLQSLDISNTIASLGGSWTDNQFQKLKDYRLQNCTLCFIPDSDIPKDGEELGAGFCNVIRNGALAMQQDFTVSVREIPNDLTVEQPKKIDPDEFFCDKSDLNKLEEREFLIWAFEKKFDKNGIDIKKIEMLKDFWGGFGRSKMNKD